MGISNFDECKHDLASGRFTDNTGVVYQPVDEFDGGLDIAGFFRILKQQWLLIAMMTILSLAAATVYSMTATTKYTASSKILINPQPKRVFGSDYIPQDGNTNQILIESQTRVIASNAVLERVVKSENLISDPEYSDAAEPGLTDWLKRLVGWQTELNEVIETPARMQEALRRLYERLAVKRPSQTYVVEVAVSSRDAEKAARLSRAVSNAYIADQAETQANNTHQISQLLQGRLATLRAKVLEAETSAQMFRQENDIVAANGSLVNERHLSRLNDELLAAKNRMAGAEAKAAKVRSLLRSGTIPENFDEAIKSRVIASLREQHAATARSESQLASVLGARHPKLISARARVLRSRQLINAELRRIANSLQADLGVEKRRVAALGKRLNRSRGVTDVTNTARVQLAALEREANANRAVYERVLTKARESNAQEKINLIDARVISYASTPLWASWPKKKIILPLALILGLGLGLGGALVNDYRQDRFTSNTDVERELGLPIIGSIPNFTQGVFSSLRSLFSRQTDGSSEQSPYYRLYLELAKVGSPYATSVMGLVRNLMKLKDPQAMPVAGAHSIMLVSSTDHEGSLSVAWSTAISAAMQKRKVLLIDGDGGNGELAETLAPDNTQALRDVLSGQGKLADLIVQDKSLGLSFLPIVTAEKKRQSIHWGDYQTLLAQLPQISKDFDLVVVDGGAILNSGLAHLLVDVVDSVAIVVRTDGTSRETVHEALRALDAPASKMRGVIVSTVDPETV
ncbi:MAG: polysaccharide biosynthesis tyrosine autokinase [bacterium]|nr:polysaccharide biosynthesis tyrosine autokinase [bacterium]